MFFSGTAFLSLAGECNKKQEVLLFRKNFISFLLDLSDELPSLAVKPSRRKACIFEMFCSFCGPCKRHFGPIFRQMERLRSEAYSDDSWENGNCAALLRLREIAIMQQCRSFSSKNIFFVLSVTSTNIFKFRRQNFSGEASEEHSFRILNSILKRAIECCKLLPLKNFHAAVMSPNKVFHSNLSHFRMVQKLWTTDWNVGCCFFPV